MNKIVLTGRLTEDVKLVTTENGLTIANFSFAVKRDRKNENGDYETDFFNIVAFRKLAENCQKYLKKGSQALISGSIQTRSYEAKDGTKRYITEVIANEVEFIGGFGQSTQKTEISTQPTAIQEDMIKLDVTDDSLPF